MISGSNSEQEPELTQEQQQSQQALQELTQRLANQELQAFNLQQEELRQKQEQESILANIARDNQIRNFLELLAALLQLQQGLLSPQDIVANLDVNQTNQFGQTLLEQAFLDQRFDAAKFLLDNGATYGPRQRSALEFSLDTDTAITRGFSSADIGSTPRPQYLHPMKEFGLTLGIEATGQDGTNSQYAHIGPTFRVVTDEISQYASQLPEGSPEQKRYAELAEAHRFADQACDYQNSRASPNAGKLLADRFQSGKTTTIPTGCKGHAMAVTLVDNHLVFTNRGIGSNPPVGTTIYEIGDKAKITPEFINKLANGVSRGTPHSEIMRSIHDVVKQPPVREIHQKPQKYDNCTIANPRSNLAGALTVMHARDDNSFQLASRSTKLPLAVKSEYKNFTANMRDNKVQQLIAKMPDPDATTLAKEYVKKHRHHSKDTARVAAVNAALDRNQLLSPPKTFTKASHHHQQAAPIAVAGAKSTLSTAVQNDPKSPKKR